jgi:hypothetical protein
MFAAHVARLASSHAKLSRPSSRTIIRAMCHHGYEPSDWRTEVEEAEEEPEDPSFLNEETDTEVELLTDGGDDDE